jgi:hypothetical protein
MYEGAPGEKQIKRTWKGKDWSGKISENAKCPRKKEETDSRRGQYVASRVPVPNRYHRYLLKKAGTVPYAHFTPLFQYLWTAESKQV